MPFCKYIEMKSLIILTQVPWQSSCLFATSQKPQIGVRLEAGEEVASDLGLVGGFSWLLLPPCWINNWLVTIQLYYTAENKLMML